MSPEDTLEHLKSISSSRIHSTLDAIYKVCCQQRELGNSDFSIATIAKVGTDLGVPKAQSIRNSTGENYRILIKSFRDSVKSGSIKKNAKGKDSWIADIEDPGLRLLVQVQAAELAEANRLISEFLPPGLEIKVTDNIIKAELNLIERRALEYLVSSSFLEDAGLILGSRGDVLDESGKTVFPVGTIDALRKALDSL
ncbi:gamma-mobile-trio protein GmtX [Litorivivens sp.]|uniref:gamma-mobile-trio protein GmtX n=1 Tax=Litorivivens sp. TaxID=2020868 RepID=UPI003564EA41